MALSPNMDKMQVHCLGSLAEHGVVSRDESEPEALAQLIVLCAGLEIAKGDDSPATALVNIIIAP